MKLRNAVKAIALSGILSSACNAPETSPELDAKTHIITRQFESRGFQYRNIEPTEGPDNTFTFPNVGIGSSVCVLARVEVTTSPAGDIKDISLVDRQFDEGQTDVQGGAYVLGNTSLKDSASLVASMDTNDRSICFPH